MYNARSTEPLLTADQFAALPGDADDSRLELVRGRVVREPPPGPEHGWLDVRLAARLLGFVEAAEAGVVLSNTGFVLATDPDTVRGPDIAFVSRERMPSLGRKYWRMAPDLAVEILSPSNSASEIQEKVLEYLAAGARLVWIVDPARRTVTVYKSARDIRILAVGEDLTADEVLPGFRLPLASLFG